MAVFLAAVEEAAAFLDANLNTFVLIFISIRSKIYIK